MATAVLNGFGPHVRFTSKSSDNKGQVKIVTAHNQVKTVPLSRVTDLKFKAA